MSGAAVNLAELVVVLRAEGAENAAGAINSVERAGTRAAKSMEGTSETARSLFFAFNGLAGSAIGVNQSLSDLFARIAQVAIGTTWTAGILLGITALGHAWQAFGGDAAAAAKASEEAAARIKATIDDLVNAGDGAKLTKVYRDALFGTRAGFFEDGITGMREQRARLVGQLNARSAQIGKLRDASGDADAGLGDAVVGKLTADIKKVDKQLDELQTTANKAYGALTDPRNGQRFTDGVANPITTSAKGVAREIKDTARDLREWESEVSRLVKMLRTPGVSNVSDTFLGRGSTLLNATVAKDDGRGNAATDGPLSASKFLKFDPKKLAGAFASPEWAKAMVLAQDQLASSLAGALTGGIASGFEAAFSGGGIGAGFKALGNSLVSGLGGALVQFGTASLKASTLMAAIQKGLASFLPGGSIAASIAMIALGGVLVGAAGRAFGGMGRGGGGGASASSFGGGYGTGGVSVIDRGFIGTPGGYTADGMRPILGLPGSVAGRIASPAGAPSFLAFQPIIIGPNDPNAQRGLVDTLRAALARGLRV